MNATKNLEDCTKYIFFLIYLIMTVSALKARQWKNVPEWHNKYKMLFQ